MSQSYTWDSFRTLAKCVFREFLNGGPNLYPGHLGQVSQICTQGMFWQLSPIRAQGILEWGPAFVFRAFVLFVWGRGHVSNL